MTMNFRVGSTGLKSMKRNANNTSTRARGALNAALRQIGRVMVPALKANTPRSGRSGGRLANSTRSLIKGGPNSQVLEIRQGARTRDGAFYGSFVRDGTRPHIIEPNRARALRFVVPGGRIVFTRRVHHPGTSPNPYHERTLREHKGDILSALDGASVEITTKFHRGVTGSRD